MTKSKYNCEKMVHTMFEGYTLLQIMRKEDNEAYSCRIIEVNEAFKEMFGIPHYEIADKTVEQVLPEIGENLFKICKGTMQVEEPMQFEFYIEKSDRHFLVRVFNPSSDKVILFFIEITLQKKAKNSFHLHEILFEHAHDIILYVTFEGRIVNANERACEKYGYTKEQLLSMTIQDIRHPSKIDEYEQQMQMADDEGIVFECIHVRSNGLSFPVEVSAKSTYTENGQFRVHIIRDITMRKKSQEKITWLAKYDPLTEIPNRANFIARLEDEIQRSMRSKIPFAVMMFDVDKFKHINDQHGHKTGDVVLHHVAQSAQKVLRAGDMVGRFGGDEFVVLQTGIKGQDDVEALARRIQASVNETITYESVTLSVKVSIGISLFPKDAMDASSLLHCADKAMYQIKQAGGGAFYFFTSCNPPCTENRLCLDENKDMERD